MCIQDLGFVEKIVILLCFSKFFFRKAIFHEFWVIVIEKILLPGRVLHLKATAIKIVGLTIIENGLPHYLY